MFNWANGNSFCFNGNSSYGADGGSCIGGGTVILRSIYANALSVVLLPRAK